MAEGEPRGVRMNVTSRYCCRALVVAVPFALFALCRGWLVERFSGGFGRCFVGEPFEPFPIGFGFARGLARGFAFF